MTVLTLRVAFVESAPRHYDRVPGAGLKGGDASRRETAGSRRVGGVMNATAFRSRPCPERETEVKKSHGGRSAERPIRTTRLAFR